jgi:hypothetical protein
MADLIAERQALDMLRATLLRQDEELKFAAQTVRGCLIKGLDLEKKVEELKGALRDCELWFSAHPEGRAMQLKCQEYLDG